MRPAAFEVDDWEDIDEEDEDDLALEALLRNASWWYRVVCDGDIEQMWRAWCQAAESFLQERTKYGKSSWYEVRERFGRFKDSRPMPRHMAARQNTAEEATEGAHNVSLRRLSRMTRHCEEILRQLRQLEERGVLTRPLELDRVWRAFHRLGKL